MRRRRGVSPVVGIVVMVAITILLAAIFASGTGAFGEGLEERKEEFDRSVTMSGNPWEGQRGDLVRPSDDRAGATDVRYRINFTIEPGSSTVGNSLNSVYLEVLTGSPDMFSATDRSDLERVGIDQGSDGSVDRDITGDVNGWSVQNGGTAVKIELSGSAYVADAGDSVIVVFGDVDNPPTPGTYDLRAQTSGDGNWHSGTVEIGPGPLVRR